MRKRRERKDKNVVVGVYGTNVALTRFRECCVQWIVAWQYLLCSYCQDGQSVVLTD